MAVPHPNAATAGAATGPTVLIVWLAGHFGLNVGAEVAVVVAGVVASGALLIGRKGLRGVIRTIWSGDQ